MARIAAEAREDRAQRGIVLMLVAYITFSFIDTSVKWLVIVGLPAVQLAFMRYAGHFAISAALLLRGGFSVDRLGSDRLGLVVLRAALLAAATVCNFYALRFLPLSVTASILFSAPLLVTALSGPLLGERVGPWRWGSVLLGFTGVLIVMQPLGESYHPAMLISLGAAAGFAGYSLLTRRFAGEVPAETMQLYTGAVGTIALLPFTVAIWENPVTVLDWALMLALGVWGWAGHQLFSHAHRFADASVLMPFTYSFLVYLTLLGFLVFGDLPDGPTVTGATIIVASGLIVWWRERRAKTAA